MGCLLDAAALTYGFPPHRTSCSPPPPAARLAYLLALICSFSSSALAQVSAFAEVSVPTENAPLFMGDGYYYAGTEVIVRSGQQGVTLDLGSAATPTVQVRSLDGKWNNGNTYTLHSGSTAPRFVEWNNLPTAPGRYAMRAIRVNYTYDFNLIVVPRANRAFRATESVGRQTLQHEILVWSGTDGGQSLDKPLLVVEGIDAANENFSESYYALGATTEAPLFPLGQAEGADIAILNFGDGGRDMRLNAAVVRQAVLAMNQYRQSWRSLDVAGVSMGGVVARYALAKMEEDGETHGVATFVSVDAPQQGAVFDTVLQAAIKQTDPAEWPASLVRPAGYQLLQDNVFDDEFSQSGHEVFFAELQALNGGTGYPQTSQNVGVSFGTPTSNPDAGSRWLRIDIDPAGGVDFYATGELTSAGSYLPLKQTQIWGRVFLIRYSFDRYANPTFIPFDSALDITNGQSAFDGPVIHAAPGEASYHDVIPTSVVTPLLNRLGYYVSPPTSLTVDGPTVLGGHQDGTFSANVNNPSTTYQYAWEWRVFPYAPSLIRSSSASASSSAPTSLTSELAAPSSEALPSGETTNHYVTYGKWHDGYGSGLTFTKSFPAGHRAEIRVTASGSGSSLTSPIHSVCIGCGGGGGNDGDALTGDGTSNSKASSTASPEVAQEAELVLSEARPNPSTGRVSFTVEALPGETAELSVYDALGRTVHAVRGIHSGPLTLDLSRFPTGPYVARITSAHQDRSVRFSLVR